MSSSLTVVRMEAPSLHRHHVAVGTPFESLTASLRLLKRLVAEQLEQDQLAVTDFWALSGIGDGETSPTELGRLLAVTPAGMTQLLDRLERRDLIRRTRDTTDRRATVLSLTSEGRRLQRRAGVRCTRFLAEFAAELTPSGKQALQTISRELETILVRRSTRPVNLE